MRKLEPVIDAAQIVSRSAAPPQREQADKSSAVSSESKSQERWERLRDAVIMMVDDEPITIEVTQVYLEEAGYSRFVSTHEAQRTLDLIRSERPDLLLLDVVMPDTDGFEILHAMDEADLRQSIISSREKDPESEVK